MLDNETTCHSQTKLESVKLRYYRFLPCGANLKGSCTSFTKILTWGKTTSGSWLALSTAVVTQVSRKSACPGQLFLTMKRGGLRCITACESVENCHGVEPSPALERSKNVNSWTKNSFGLPCRDMHLVGLYTDISCSKLVVLPSTPQMPLPWHHAMIMTTNESKLVWSFFANSSRTPIISVLSRLHLTFTSKERFLKRSQSFFASGVNFKLFIRRQIPRGWSGLIM